MLPRHARCVVSRLRCNGHSLLLGSYLSRIGRIENPSCSACGHSSQDTSHLILHCPATDSLRSWTVQTLVSLRPLVQAQGSCPASGAPWSSAMPASFGRGRVTTTGANRCSTSCLSYSSLAPPLPAESLLPLPFSLIPRYPSMNGPSSFQFRFGQTESVTKTL